MKILIIYLSIFFGFCQSNPKPLKTYNQNHATDSDSLLLDSIQRQCFNYYWLGSDTVSTAARERIHLDQIYEWGDSSIVTSGGTGFAVMATLVAIHRHFISRSQGYERLNHLVDWLIRADRFHGAFPHWWLPDGSVKPFSKYDDGGDIVETAYLTQGLLCAKQFFKDGNQDEINLAQKIDQLWRDVDWSFYTHWKNVLYWHWSPHYGWKMNFAIRGYNECLIPYILAASSPTHPIDTSVFYEGFMKSGKIVTDRVMYDLPTILDHYDNNNNAVGPLFWAQYSYLGLDPRHLKDRYADYWKVNQNHAMIHYRYCMDNPKHFNGYSDSCWGLTSSYSLGGYATHSPEEDNGEISPTAALASFPYTPAESYKFLKYVYNDKNNKLVGAYGPYDVFNPGTGWTLPRYLAIDQLPIPVMIENYRSGLLWNLFMSNEDIQNGLLRLGMSY